MLHVERAQIKPEDISRGRDQVVDEPDRRCGAQWVASVTVPASIARAWENGMMIGFIIALVLSGLIVGALGRLAIPGPNPMSIPMTIAVGIGGSLLGGVVGNLVFGRPGGLLLAVAGAALIVWLVERDRAGGRPLRQSPP